MDALVLYHCAWQLDLLSRCHAQWHTKLVRQYSIIMHPVITLSVSVSNDIWLHNKLNVRSQSRSEIEQLNYISEEEGEETDTEAPKIYEPIRNFKELADRLEMYQQQYNETIRGAKMDLVFFKVRICTSMQVCYVRLQKILSPFKPN